MGDMDEWNQYMQEVKDNRLDVYDRQNVETKLIKKGCEVTPYDYAKEFTIIVHPEHGKMFFYPRTNTLKLFKYEETIKKKGKNGLLITY